MKSILLKLLSALLALCMAAAAFTTVFVSSASFADDEDATPAGEGEEEQPAEDVGFKATDLETIRYASDKDKLLTMCKTTPILDAKGDPVLDGNDNPTYVYEPWLTKGDYELYVQEKTGEVAVRNNKTGQILFTNPYDVRASVASASTYKPLFAQLSIKYQTIKDGKTSTMNSYEDGAARDQIVVSYIKNGVCVEYTIGRADERRLVPFWMEKYRFEKLLLSKMTGEGAELAYTKMNAFYMELDMNASDMTATYIAELESRYPCLGQWSGSTAKSTYQSEDYDESLESEYAARRAAGELAVPYKGRMSIRVLAEDQTTNYEKNKIEEYIRSYSPEYNYEMLAYDHELTGFVGKRATLPIFKMALEYRINDDGFSVRLPANSITFDEDNFRLLSIDVLPYMGAGSSENTGYTFVPDGSGTLIRFEDVKNVAVGFNTGTMYGPDNAYHTLPTEYTGQAEIMRYPVFGVVEDVAKSYTLKDDGTYEEVCPHRFVKKTVAPDCTTQTDGYDYEYCAVCGLRGAVSNVKKWAHTFTGNPTVVQEATCHQYRITTQVCTVCQAAYAAQSKELKAQGASDAEIEERIGHLRTIRTVSETYGEHVFEEFIVADTENHVCYEESRCVTLYQPVDENGEPMVDEEGNPVMVECGFVQSKSPTDHTYAGEDVEVNKDGRCYLTNTCSECGFVLEQEIPHTFSGEDKVVYDTASHRCTLQNTCDKCGFVQKVDIDHEFGDPVYTEQDGLCVTTRTCRHCGFVEVTKQAHRPGGNAETKYDTNAHLCLRESVCETCGKTIRTQIDHEMENGVCVRCGYTVPVVEGHHLEEGYVHVGNRCYRTFLCSDEGCGYEMTSARVEVTHRYSDKTFVQPTCTERGYLAFVCLNCGYHADVTPVEEEEADPLGHNYVWTNDQKKSCLESYVSEHKCERCGNVDDTKVVPAEGHVYEETVVIAETETESGIYRHVCTFCGHVYYETRAPKPAQEPEEPEEPEEPANQPNAEAQESEEPAEPTQVSFTHGYVGIVTSGSSLASLTSSHGGSLHKYNYVYMTVTPRPQDSYNLRDSISTGADASWTVVSERKYNGSYAIRYFMLQTVQKDAPAVGLSDSEYQAGYVGMAAAYRDYLEKNGTLTALPQRDDGIPMYLEAFGAITVNTTFLTVPTTEKKALTTFEDLRAIAEELKEVKNEAGEVVCRITNLNLKLTGFANNGMNYDVPYKVKFEKVVGGDKGFTEFVQYAQEKQIGVYPDFDFAYLKHTSLFDGYSDSKHAVKTIDGRYIVKKEYDSTLQIFTGTGLLAISSSVYDYFYNGFNKNYAKFGNQGISVSSLGTDLNSDFDRDEPYNREDSREFTERILRKMKADYGSIMTSGGNAYTLPYVDHILNMSLSGSNYLRTSESVPFMSMVLHGSKSYAGTVTNMASSLDQEILHIIENGASPYFLIATRNTGYLKENSKLSKYYSVDYSTWKSDIIETYRVLNEALQDVQFAKFTEHCFLEGERIPDADEISDDYKTAKAAIDRAISTYLAAERRAASAAALIERKSVTEPNAYRAQLLEILGRYDFVPVQDSAMEPMDVKLSDADETAAQALARRIADAQELGSNERLIANVGSARQALERATETFETSMAQYEYLFDVKAEDRLDSSAYNKNSYRGAIYTDKDGKYVVSAPENGTARSAYAVTDKSIVKVGYDNGVTFYLNYNYFDVLVQIDGENVVIEAYSFIKRS